MPIEQYRDPIVIKWYTDFSGKKISIARNNEEYTVVNGQILLSEIPDEINGVSISGLAEVRRDKVLGTNEFKVNYTQGIVRFHSSKEGQSIIVSFHSRGVVFYPAERIYTKLGQNMEIEKTVQDIIDRVPELQSTIDTGENVILELDILKSELESIQDHWTQLEPLIQDVLDSENARVSAESTRQSNENSRVGAENGRVTAEQNRVSAENQRVTAENNREDDYYNSLKPDVLSATQDANTAAQNTNIAISSAESLVEDTGYVEEYNPSTAYKKNNIVYYDGNSFIARVDNQNQPLPILPQTETTYWALIAREGLGDMEKSEYDSTNSGVVDDAEKLGGEQPSAFEKTENKGVNNGYAPLNSEGKVPNEHLPERPAPISQRFRITIAEITNSVSLSSNGVSETDSMLVYQDGLFLQETEDYIITTGPNIEKVTGDWSVDTKLDFVVL